MSIQEIKEAINFKAMEFEVALETGKPRNHVMKLYKELKDLQYKLVQLELTHEKHQDPDIA
jgi:hypothetical protein